MNRICWLIIFLFATIFCFAQESIPCKDLVYDTETEIRELGIGQGESVLDATIGAVSNALGRMKRRLKNTLPEVVFLYETKTVSSDKGEQVEIETTLGQPNIICNEVQQLAEDNFKVYLVLSVKL